MLVKFFDRQDESNPFNGHAIDDHTQLSKILESCHDREPFFAELVEEGSHKLLIGIGATIGCAQFSRTDGNPPYLMALAADQNVEEGAVEFLCGGTATPVPMRYVLPHEDVKAIAIAFLQTGQCSNRASWEEI